MNLYLMRHGLAVERGTPGYDSDRERPLTPKGERKTQRSAEALAEMEITFDAILASPLIRSHQTAGVVIEAMNARQKLQLTEHLAPGASAKELVGLLQSLAGQPQEILLVGHEPDLGHFASLLLAGGDALEVTFKKGGIAKLAIQNLRAGRCATLEWLLTPRQLGMMA